MAIAPYVSTYSRPRPTERGGGGGGGGGGVSRGNGLGLMSLGGHVHIVRDFQLVDVY
jgi:hypothetical protein